MYDGLPSHHAVIPAWWRRKSIWVIVAGGVLALFLWTIPNWGTFWDNVAQFPTLWQIPGNRRIIVYLIIKVFAPVLIMLLLTALVWMYTQIRDPEPEETDVSGQIPQRAGQDTFAASLSGTTYLPVQQMMEKRLTLPLAREVREPRRSGGLPSRQVNPITPLPEVMPAANVLRSSLSDVSQSEVAVVQNEMPLIQQEKADTEREQSSNGSSALAFEMARPVISTNGRVAMPDPLITIRLLKDVTMAICTPGGGRVVVPLTLNAKRVQLLAYIACRRGELIDRDKILEHIFGWGLRDEDATEDKLSERFESHKKLLRRKIREIVVEQVNTPAGKQVIDPDIDPFTSDAGFWGLSDICRVEDLEEIERLYKVIALARKDGKLGGDEIPEFVKEACDELIANYAGDFLETIIKKYPGEFKPWGGRSSWARKPYTQYRDYYLEALWYSAEYEWRAGQKIGAELEKAVQERNEQKQQEALRRQQEYFGRAAQRYQSYAMYACNSKFDAKATFGAHGEYGERIGMSERALRRCVVLLGAIGRTDLVNQVWAGYRSQMKSISDQRWQPSKETQADVEAARAQTNAYRFSAQVSQLSSEFADRDRQGRAS
jgi:hypothetical protein